MNINDEIISKITFEDFLNSETPDRIGNRIEKYRSKINARLCTYHNYTEKSLIRLNEIFQLSLLLEYLYSKHLPTDKYENILKIEFIKKISSSITMKSEVIDRSCYYWSNLNIKDFLIGEVYTNMLFEYLGFEDLQNVIKNCIADISQNYDINSIPDLININQVLIAQSANNINL